MFFSPRAERNMLQRMKWNIGIGGLALLAGFLFYSMFRWKSPLLVQDIVGNRLYIGAYVPVSWRPALDSLPTALHVFAFSLLTIGIAGLPGFWPRCGFTAAWVGIDLLFELAQAVNHAAFGRALARLSMGGGLLQQFVTDGVFDMKDITGAVIGGLLAMLVSSVTTSKEGI